MDFQAARTRMTAEQLVARGIRDREVLAAMERVPRERFVLPEDRCRACEDRPLGIGFAQTISQPYMVARMTELLHLSGAEKVLEIGTGSGYQTAILAEGAREVFTVERIATLSEWAAETLAALGYANVRLRVGDGSLGWPEEAPFDRILAAAGAPEVPPSLSAQLAPGGTMVAPIGSERDQTLTVLSRSADGRTFVRRDTPCHFVKLIGREGWPEEGAGRI